MLSLTYGLPAADAEIRTLSQSDNISVLTRPLPSILDEQKIFVGEPAFAYLHRLKNLWLRFFALATYPSNQRGGPWEI